MFHKHYEVFWVFKDVQVSIFSSSTTTFTACHRFPPSSPVPTTHSCCRPAPSVFFGMSIYNICSIYFRFHIYELFLWLVVSCSPSCTLGVFLSLVLSPARLSRGGRQCVSEWWRFWQGRAWLLIKPNRAAPPHSITFLRYWRLPSPL